MSMITSSSDYANRLNVQIAGASGQYTFLIPIKRTSDSGGTETVTQMVDDSSSSDSLARINSGDRFESYYSLITATAAWGPNPVALNTWYWLLIVAPGDNTFASYWMAEGAGSWTAGPTDGGGYQDKILNDVWLGRYSGGEPFTGIIGPTKMWNIAYAAADILTNEEHKYRNVQANTSNDTGCFKFADNGGTASAVDSSGTGDLTLFSSPVYSADEPSDILGDDPAAASGAVTGTLSNGATEAEIRAGGETAIITLTGDTWVASGATFNAQRQAIIDGFDSGSAGATGWDAVVKALTPVTDVVRTSDTVVTVTFSARSTYNISANETITVTIPAAALTGAQAIVATPTFTITSGNDSDIATNDTPGIIQAYATASGDFSSIRSGIDIIQKYNES